jgi:phospho-N-acetylmuramoyl-pentapeptide-transferase
MIFHASQALKTSCSFLNVFHYVSVRASGAFLTSLFFAFLLGNWFIKKSQIYFRSKVRELTPESHQVKNDTPTMGGLFILLIFGINTLLWNDLTNLKVWLFVVCTFGFGFIGFLDDWYKIKYKKGISASLKFRLQLVFSTLIIGVWYFVCNPNTELCIPFLKDLTPVLGWLIIPWAVFIILSTCNAVNLTDGLDGLATGPLIFNFTTFSIIAYFAGHKAFANYLLIPYAGSAELAIFCATFIGALLGFLWYNTYPAQIFMGDVGSMALGASLALTAIMARQELLLLICGGIFVMETVSVIIQVVSFKLRGKRIFKMAPIHHHFELIGWKETKITVRFWIISIILSVITLLTLKLR